MVYASDKDRHLRDDSRSSMTPFRKNGFRIHEYEVNPAEREIVGPNGASCVQPEAMDVLLHLAEHAGQVIKPDMVNPCVENGIGAGGNLNRDRRMVDSGEGVR